MRRYSYKIGDGKWLLNAANLWVPSASAVDIGIAISTNLEAVAEYIVVRHNSVVGKTAVFLNLSPTVLTRCSLWRMPWSAPRQYDTECSVINPQKFGDLGMGVLQPRPEKTICCYTWTHHVLIREATTVIIVRSITQTIFDIKVMVQCNFLTRQLNVDAILKSLLPHCFQNS